MSAADFKLVRFGLWNDPRAYAALDRIEALQGELVDTLSWTKEQLARWVEHAEDLLDEDEPEDAARMDLDRRAVEAAKTVLAKAREGAGP